MALVILLIILLFLLAHKQAMAQEEILEGSIPHIKKIEAVPDVGMVRLKWELEDEEDIDYLEVYSKYEDEEFYTKIDNFSPSNSEIILPAEPLVAVTYLVRVVYQDGKQSKGVTVTTRAKHKNVVYERWVDEGEDLNQLQEEGLNIRERELLIYLPEGYDANRKEKYPVVYMHDGQNLFSDRLAYLWEWRVDETLDRLIGEKIIPPLVVVGIYNSSKRCDEYTPFAIRREDDEKKNRGYPLEEGRGGKAKAFADVVVNKIKPFVERKYNVATNREKVAVMGSSFGGILSLWMLYEYKDVFSMAAAISPSLWICDYKMLEKLEEWDKVKNSKIWIDQGTGEFSKATRNAVKILQKKGYKYGKELLYYEVKKAKHDELAWAKRIDCPFIFFMKDNLGDINLIEINRDEVKPFSIGLPEVIINPVGYFKSGIRYSLFNTAKYSIALPEGKEFKAIDDIESLKALEIKKKVKHPIVDQYGMVDFNGKSFALVYVKYKSPNGKQFKQMVTVKNPLASKKPVRVKIKEKLKKKMKSFKKHCKKCPK